MFRSVAYDWQCRVATGVELSKDHKKEAVHVFLATMLRSRVHHEQLLVDLLRYRSYLVQDPCANSRAQAYVEAQISFCQGMNAPRNDCTGSGEPAG